MPYADHVPRPRRLILKLCFCLLAGAAATWGFAWAVAIWKEEPPPSQVQQLDVSRWFSTESQLPDKTPRWLEGGEDWASKWVFAEYNGPHSPLLIVDEYGWPWRSMYAARLSIPSTFAEWQSGLLARFRRASGQATPPTPQAAPPPPIRKLDNSLPAPAWLRPKEANARLPIKVFAAGFAANSLLTAGLFFAIVQSAAWARHRWSRTHDRCTACAYDRRGLAPDAPCPECGIKP
jgi:hypothetical protein